jgi:hypothetical protein
MINWLKADLAATTKKWKIAFWHQCPYSGQDDFTEQSSFQYFTYAARAHFNPHLEQYGVDLVLTGHDHNYQRSYLVNGLYDFKAAFTPFNILNGSSGNADIGEEYIKYTNGPEAGKGTVYVVSGSSGRVDYGQRSFPHDAMPFADTLNGGACILEVESNRLDLKWICADGKIRDHFTMMKNVNSRSVIKIRKGEKATLKASWIGDYNWQGMNTKTRSIEVKPAAGTTTYTVNDPHGCIHDTFEVQVIK